MDVPARYRWIAANILPHEPELRGWLRRRLGALGDNDVDDLVQWRTGFFARAIATIPAPSGRALEDQISEASVFSCMKLSISDFPLVSQTRSAFA
jgi:hypothetical protein